MKSLVTPWGSAERITEVAPAIQRVSTAHHGGYRLSHARQQQLSKAIGASVEWFEEDNDAAIVEAAFQDAFDSERAKKRLYDTYPELMEKICGVSAGGYIQGKAAELKKSFQSDPDAWFIAQPIGILDPDILRRSSCADSGQRRKC